MPIPDYSLIPAYTMGAIKRYIDHHIEPGGFLTAVLENNLREALGRADEFNNAALFHIAAYLYNEAPADCWGSVEKVERWLEEIPA